MDSKTTRFYDSRKSDTLLYIGESPQICCSETTYLREYVLEEREMCKRAQEQLIRFEKQIKYLESQIIQYVREGCTEVVALMGLAVNKEMFDRKQEILKAKAYISQIALEMAAKREVTLSVDELKSKLKKNLVCVQPPKYTMRSLVEKIFFADKVIDIRQTVNSYDHLDRSRSSQTSVFEDLDQNDHHNRITTQTSDIKPQSGNHLPDSGLDTHSNRYPIINKRIPDTSAGSGVSSNHETTQLIPVATELKLILDKPTSPDNDSLSQQEITLTYNREYLASTSEDVQAQPKPNSNDNEYGVREDIKIVETSNRHTEITHMGENVNFLNEPPDANLQQKAPKVRDKPNVNQVSDEDVCDLPIIEKRRNELQCRFCSLAFRYPSQRRKHEKSHKNSRPFQCSFCDKCFNDASSHNNHERTHTKERPFSCKFCDKKFIAKHHWLEHERYHTGTKPYPCRHCEKSFYTSTQRSDHERLHTGSKPFKCEICGKAFAQKSHLSKHEITHSGKKPFACRICGKTFSQSSNCHSHEKSHLEEKNFSCKFCGQTFSRQEKCQSHELTHELTHDQPRVCEPTDEVSNATSPPTLSKQNKLDKLYICVHCGKGFSYPSACKEHERIHTQERPFNCLVCSKSFYKSSDLKRHEKTHNKNATTTCNNLTQSSS